MKKRVFSLFLALVVTFSMVCPLVFADDSSTHVHNWTSGVISEFSDTVEGIPVSVSVKKCTECNFYKHTYKFFGLSFDFYSVTAYTGIVDDFLLDVSLHIMNALGKNATAKKYETGGGSAGSSGVGRHPSGYENDTGTPSVNSSGAYTISAPLRLYPDRFNTASGGTSVSHSQYDSYSLSSGNLAVVGSTTGIRVTNGGSTDAYIIFRGGYKVNVPAAGYIGVSKGTKVYVGMGPRVRSSDDAKELWSIEHPYSISYNKISGKSVTEKSVYFINFDITDSSILTSTSEFTSSKVEISFGALPSLVLWIPKNSETFFAYNSIPVSYVPSTTTINQTNNITINNNTWNGNIYQDNSTNLTYIYPQYTTINENNETVTNISNNPIIYNNETKQYYTYDTVTNNYYYITYEAPSPSPSPSPSPEPSETPAPTPAPGGDTGDTSSLLDVLIEIKDNMIQGFADIKATLVQGWADLSANFTLAIENLNVNIQNIFNKKFPDQSTPGTTPPSPTPSPSPEPVDPILPETQNLIIPKMNSNTFTDEHGTWVASGFSKYSDVFDFFYAFDRSTANFWETNASPSHLQIEIPDPESYYIDGYLMRISKFNNRYPKDWTLQGSDDGKTWDDLDKQTGQDLSDMEEHKYPLTLRKAYKYYRVNMSNYASSMCSLSHFNLLGYDAKDVVTPTPSPSLAPDPGTNPTPTPKTDGSGDVSTPESGKPGSSSGGQSWWEKLLGKIGDAIMDGLLGAISAVLKLIFKLFTTILGWIIWLVSQVLTLFPFLPPGLGALLIGGVVVCFIIGLIKFIRG